MWAMREYEEIEKEMEYYECKSINEKGKEPTDIIRSETNRKFAMYQINGIKDKNQIK